MSDSLASSKVARGAIYFFSFGIVLNLLSLIYLIFAARIIDPAEVGLLIGLGLVTTLVVTFGTLGIPYGVIRFLAEIIGRKEERVAKHIWRKTVVIGAGLSGILSVGVFLSAPSLAYIFIGSSGFTFLVQLIAFDVFAMLFSHFFSGPLHARLQFGLITGIELTVAILKNMLPILLLLGGYGVLGVVLAWIASDYVLLLLYAIGGLRWGGLGSISGSIKDLLKYSFSLHGSNTTNFVSTYLERYLVLFFLDLGSMAFYGVAVVAANVIIMAANSLGQALLPALSRLYGSTNTHYMKLASERSNRYIMIVCIPAAVGLALIADIIFTLIRPEYYAAVSPTILLCIATTIMSIGIVANAVLLSMGRPRKVLEGNLLGIGGNFLVSLLFLPILGILGAALGRTAHILLTTAYSCIVLKRNDLFGFDKKDAGKILLSTTAMAFAVILTRILLPAPHLLFFFVLVGFISFIVSVRLTRIMKPEDYILIEQLLPKKLKRLADWTKRILG